MLAATVLGAGSWGTALAAHLARRGHDVVLWDRNPDRAAHIDAHHANPRYLVGEPLPGNLRASSDLEASVARAELLVPVVPSHALREVMEACASAIPDRALVACATKGIEEGSLTCMPSVLQDVLRPDLHPGVTLLSGPSFAKELVRELPTAVVIAGADRAAHAVAEAFHGGSFRAYVTEDVYGVAFGGSLKNVMAIACGVSDGLGLGSNARAALITRGLAEITRLAVSRGANPLTLMGLAGMGDLVLTSTVDLSRNRRVGLALGQGRTLDDVLTELGEVAEGVVTTRSAFQLSHKLGVELPITEQMYGLIYDGRPATEALDRLLSRDRKHERA